MKNKLTLIFILSFLITQCGEDKINFLPEDAGDNILMGSVSEDSQTVVTIPEVYFGDNITEASLDVFVNGRQIAEGMNPSDSDYFDAEAGLVDFKLSLVNDGDIISLTIYTTSSVDQFQATVSADAAVFAVSVVEDETSTVSVSPL